MQIGLAPPTAIVGSDSDKRAQLRALAKLRSRPTAGTRRDGFSQDYRRIEELCPWLGDCAWVSPLAITAKNVHSDLMIIGQDWAGERYLTRRGDPDRLRSGYDAKLQTNITLASLLKEAFTREFDQVFATNAFVFIKPGGMTGSIPAGDLRHSTKTYTLREIAIVRPMMVICLGADAYNALRRSQGMPFQQLKDANHDTPELVITGAEIYGVPHTGALGQSSTGGYTVSLAIWKRLAKRLEHLRASNPSVTYVCDQRIDQH